MDWVLVLEKDAFQNWTMAKMNGQIIMIESCDVSCVSNSPLVHRSEEYAQKFHELSSKFF